MVTLLVSGIFDAPWPVFRVTNRVVFQVAASAPVVVQCMTRMCVEIFLSHMPSESICRSSSFELVNLVHVARDVSVDDSVS